MTKHELNNLFSGDWLIDCMNKNLAFFDRIGEGHNCKIVVIKNLDKDGRFKDEYYSENIFIEQFRVRENRKKTIKIKIQEI